MIHGVRARLALWYAGTFALLLGVFAAFSYLFLEHTTRARIDEYLAETADAVAGALAVERAAGTADSAAVAAVVREFRYRDIGVAIYDSATGAVVARSPASVTEASDDSLVPPVVSADEPDTWTAHTAGGAVRVHASPLRMGGWPLIVRTTRSLASQQRMLDEARDALLVGVPLGLLLATIGGYALARKGLQPVVTMSDAAARMGAATLGERLPVGNARDELGRLATVFNSLLERLDRSFAQQRRFTADASHELRTPVAIIRGEAELALSRDDRAAGALRESLAAVHGEAQRLTRIVDDLFLLARGDAGDQPLVDQALYLEEVAGESVHAVRTLAARREIAVRWEPSGELPFRGDEGLLRRMLINLLDNAIKYAPAGSTVRVAAMRHDGRYLVTVADNGTGVPAEAQPYIFQRFYRAHREDVASGGAGLGLPIARWIAEAHGGRLELTRSDDSGSTFTVELPAPHA